MAITNKISIKRQIDRWYPLIDHPVQLQLMEAVSKGVRFPVVPAGRRCLEKGTLVATPSGPKYIETLSAGDAVIGFDDNKPSICYVTATHNNGRQIVTPLLSGGNEYLAATESHKLWACNESDFDKRRKHLFKGYERLSISEITFRNRVRRAYSFDLIGNEGKHMPLAYALGALLGDGCSRDNKSTNGQYQKQLNISSDDETVPKKIAEIMGCGYRKLPSNNYTWAIDIGFGVLDAIPFYREWCAERYAHEKIADWNEINTWDKKSALSFLSGIIDTDGSIYYKSKKNTEAVINVAMQAKSVVECCCNIVFKFFQDRLSVNIDSREKYKKGSVYSAKTTSNLQVVNILGGIRELLVKKQDKINVDNLVIRNVLPDRIGFKKGNPRWADTFDITVSNFTNLYCLHNGGIVTSNSGKTERLKRFIAKEAIKNDNEKYFLGAPTYNQAKKIFWEDLKKLTISSIHPKQPSESGLIIFLPNGSEIHIIGFDKPARFEGVPWTGGGIDEIADIKPDAWDLNIKPALNTVSPLRPDYRAWCWLIGVPDGLNHYYDMAEYAKSGIDKEWGLFHWKSSEILPPDIIESEKKRMSPKQFKQEYEGSFETVSGKIYEDYGVENYTKEKIQSHEQIHWSHDQNYTPLSSCIAVIREDNIFFLDEIVLRSAISRQSAEEFVEKYKNHKNKHVIVYGDPSGKKGEKHGHASDYTEIEGVLKKNGWKFTRKVAKAHPAIKDRQNSVRAKICNARGERRLFVNPQNAKYCHKGLSTVQVKKGSTFIEEESDYQHITTAIGYFIHRLYPIKQNYEGGVSPIAGYY